MMLLPNRLPLHRSVRLLSFAASLPFVAAGLLAQTPALGTSRVPSPSSSSSSSQTGTTAAPGTAPMRSRATAQQIAPVRVATYDEKYELFGGLSLMNGQAGQNLPKRYVLGGGEVMGTYWLGSHLGIAADYRLEAGTTPVLSPYYNRVLVYQNIAAGGVEYRGPRNRYAAVDFHALAGFSHGTFDNAVKNYPGGSPVSACPQQQATGQQGNLGLYCNSNSPWGAAGGSVDFNYSPRLAIRLQPDLIMEHFGTELREFVSVSGGVVYRFGRR